MQTYTCVGIIKKKVNDTTCIDYILSNGLKNANYCSFSIDIFHDRMCHSNYHSYGLDITERFSYINLMGDEMEATIEDNAQSMRFRLNSVDVLKNTKYAYNPYNLEKHAFPLEYTRKNGFGAMHIPLWLCQLCDQARMARPGMPSFTQKLYTENLKRNIRAQLALGLQKSRVPMPAAVIDDFMAFATTVWYYVDDRIEYEPRCMECGFADCLRGGCTGQRVTPAEAIRLYSERPPRPQWQTLFDQVKYSGKIEEWRFRGLVPTENWGSRHHVHLRELWRQAILV